jgi:hypothetical protein
MKSFTGRLSQDRRLITDHAWGEIETLRTVPTIQWHGTIHFPIAGRILTVESEPVRLDCVDGFTVLVDLLESTMTSDDQWVTSNFLSHAATRD